MRRPQRIRLPRSPCHASPRSAWASIGSWPSLSGSWPTESSPQQLVSETSPYRNCSTTRDEATPMAETNNTRDLLATLRDALRALELTLPLARESVDEIASQAERIRDSVAALGELRQGEDTSGGIEMFVAAAVDLLEACRALEAGILDVQAEVDTLEAELADAEDGQQA